jgi:hypothetical protein
VGVPLHYPEAVRRALEQLLRSLEPCAPEPYALAVYGSLARRTFRKGESDVNVALVLTTASPQVLASLSAPMREAWRAARIEPLVLMRSELPRITDAFPIKLFDIKQHHDLIHGTEPFSELEVKWADMRVRAEQELRNHLLRLRRGWLFADCDVRALAPSLFHSAKSLLFELEALLWLKSENVRGLTPPEVFEKAARVFGLDAAVLEALDAFSSGSRAPDASELYAGLLELLGRAVEIADRMERDG